MIILDELPFIFVEKVEFVRFMKRCCPMFDIPGRKTIRTDCVKIFLERKDSLKSFFNSKGSGTISITTDCWTSLRNHSFICLTAHFIGRNWQLHKKIINFKKITSHKGEDVADSIITCLDEWGIKRVLCCTLDNASANDVAIRHLRERLQLRVGNTLDGRFLHMRCVAHIINLVVQTGIEVIGISVRRVREACKWITASAESMLIKYTKELTLDMPTRWNATYIMLEHAEPYEEAFRCYEGMMPAFVADLNKLTHDGIVVGPPTSEDWTKVRWMMEYLKKFYDLTKMCDLLDFINNMADSDDEEIKSMALRMKAKVAKYWSEEIEDNTRMNKLLYIAAVIDPRQKLRHVEKCLKHIYCSYRASELVLGVRVVLSELVEAYRHHLLPPRPPRDADVDASQGSNSGSASAKRQRVADALKRRSDRGSLSSLRSDSDDDEYTHMDELSLYLNEGTFKERKSAHQGDGNETDVVDKFDVLKWWSTYGLAYPILSEIARDVLAIPISSVASEAAFSTGGRIMDSYRTSLHPNMLEAIVCTEDWLRSADSVPTVEELSEHEQEMLYMNGKLLTLKIQYHAYFRSC
ncbi:Putative AC transposase [Linum perenne]